MAMKTFCVDRHKIEHFAIGDKQSEPVFHANAGNLEGEL
jgi:hypothetical protein